MWIQTRSAHHTRLINTKAVRFRARIHAAKVLQRRQNNLLLSHGQYAHYTSGGDFSLSQECIMKIRWALFSAAMLFGFLPSQATSEEAILGQGNISCRSWIE